jgi:lysocardiolipin and lysophospholipid acyltransferase
MKSSNGLNSILATQLIGAPLYWIDRDLYYAYMALTKQSFLLLITTISQWSGPTLLRVSGDESVSGQIRRTADGRVEYNFPDRIVLIANHQVMFLFLYYKLAG